MQYVTKNIVAEILYVPILFALITLWLYHCILFALVTLW